MKKRFNNLTMCVMIIALVAISLVGCDGKKQGDVNGEPKGDAIVATKNALDIVPQENETLPSVASPKEETSNVANVETPIAEANVVQDTQPQAGQQIGLKEEPKEDASADDELLTEIIDALESKGYWLKEGIEKPNRITCSTSEVGIIKSPEGLGIFGKHYGGFNFDGEAVKKTTPFVWLNNNNQPLKDGFTQLYDYATKRGFKEIEKIDATLFMPLGLEVTLKGNITYLDFRESFKPFTPKYEEDFYSNQRVFLCVNWKEGNQPVAAFMTK